MADSTSWRLPPSGVALDQVLTILLALDREAFESLERRVHGPETFDWDGYDLQGLSEAIGGDARSVGLLLDALGFLFDELSPSEGGGGREAIEDLVAASLGKADVRCVELLSRLLTSNEAATRASRLRRLRAGPPEAVQSFDVVVDLRPGFSVDGSKLVGVASVVQLRMVMEADGREVAFRIDERAIASLRRAVHEIDRRTALIIESPIFQSSMKDF